MWIWDSRTHQFIVSKALKKCKTSFANLLKLHQGMFILGIEAPDRIFKDFTNHYYNCTPNQYGFHSGSIIKKINSEIIRLQEMLNKPDEIIFHHKIAPFLKKILDTPLKAFIFELGVLSHYVADLHQPFHTDGKYRFDDEETVHQIMEADTRKALDTFSIKMGRRRRIKNPHQYFTEQISEINLFYDELVTAYYLRKGKVKPDRKENAFSTIENCLCQAAWNIANIFLDFEDATSILKKQIQHAKLIKKINSAINPKYSYQIRKYPSGTVSIRRK